MPEVGFGVVTAEVIKGEERLGISREVGVAWGMKEAGEVGRVKGWLWVAGRGSEELVRVGDGSEFACPRTSPPVILRVQQPVRGWRVGAPEPPAESPA